MTKEAAKGTKILWGTIVIPVSVVFSKSVKNGEGVTIHMPLFQFDSPVITEKNNLFNHSTSHVASWLGRKPYVHAVGSNSLETTYILFELPYKLGMLY